MTPAARGAMTPGAGSAPILETEQLTKTYSRRREPPVVALEDATLAVPKGSFCAITGPSGCGKTTLLSLLGLLEWPTSGRIIYNGEDYAKFSQTERSRARRRMGFVFQDYGLIPSLSAVENVVYPLIPRGIARQEREQRAHAALETLGVLDKASTAVRELSGGEQQRVAVARAVAGQPEVLFADEPTSNLDAETAQMLLDVFSRIHADGCTVVVATHDPTLTSLATLRFHLHQGRLASTV